MPDPTYNVASNDESIRTRSRVRLLLNDVAAPWVFTDEEIQAFLDLEGGNTKLAAAQAIDTNADDQALASKVLRSQDINTDGAKLADALHKRAEQLRAQARAEADDADDGYFELVGPPTGCRPELTERPATGLLGWP